MQRLARTFIGANRYPTWVCSNGKNCVPSSGGVWGVSRTRPNGSQFGQKDDVDESRRECAVRWQVPAPPNSGREYTGYTSTAHSVEEIFALITRAEQEVFARCGVVSAVCLDDPSGECLYVGSAGDRWSLYYLRMPDVGDG